MGINGNRRCIFLYVNQGFAVRYLLRTDILRTLRDGSVQIVILSPNGDEPVFRQAFESENVKVEKCNHGAYKSYLKSARLERILRNLRAFVLNGKYDTRTVDDFRAIYRGQRGWTFEDGIIPYTKGLLWETVSNILKHSRFLRRFLISFESRFYCPGIHEELFKKYSPDLVVTTAIAGFEYNELFAREAKHYGVPTCAVILSWDNTSGMGMAGYNPDYVIAWTENMKRELIELNDIDGKKVFVGGVAHFDPYYSRDFISPKEEIFHQLGLNPKKKTIFYATKSPKRFPWGSELVADLAKAIEEGKIKDEPQILVRLHPLHFRTSNGRLIFKDIIESYERIAKEYPSVVLNIPWTVSRKMDFDLADSETKLVASILKHSDVMINMFSTMVIEAAIFHLPSVNMAIRDKCKADFGKSRQDIMIDYVQTHNQRVIQTNGVKTVFTMEELCSALNLYMENPDLDREGREKIIQNEAGPCRGEAGKTIGRHILSLVGL